MKSFMHSNIRTFEFNASSIEIEVKDLNFIKELPKLLGKPHKTTFYQLVWLTRGEATFRVDFKEVRIRADEVLVISAGQVCAFDTKADYAGKIVLFTSSFFSVSEHDSSFLHTSEILNPVNLNRTVAICPQLTGKLISLLEEELNFPEDNFRAVIAQSYLRIILLEAERRYANSYSFGRNNVGRKFYNAVEKHFKENRNADFYVRLLGINEKTLAKEIKALCGKTPKKYIDSRVLLEAKRLLAYSGLSAKEIGINLGFDEPSNFNKYFRKHASLTPVEFRNSTVT